MQRQMEAEKKAAQQPAEEAIAHCSKDDPSTLQNLKVKQSKKEAAIIKAIVANFAKEVPQELISINLRNNPGKAFTPQAEALREFRQRRRAEIDCWTNDPSAWGDYKDIFDLRYLFNELEIQENKKMLIVEYNEYRHWWSTEPSETDYYSLLKYEAKKASKQEEDTHYAYEDLTEMDMELEEVDEWVDNCEVDWRRARYVEGLGFVLDDYDSGHDEPNDLTDPYPPVKNEHFVNINKKERIMKECIERVKNGAHRRTYNQTKKLTRRCRRPPPKEDEPGCSFH